MAMSAGYIPFHPNPSKPKFKPPPGAVDAHCHVFGPEDKFPYAPERKYTPCDAPKEKLFALRDFLGFDKNVIVQASCHSKDNRAMVDALGSSGGKAKGVAFVGGEVSDDELKWMDRAGVKGVRFNFVKRLVDFTPRDVLERIAALVNEKILTDITAVRDESDENTRVVIEIKRDAIPKVVINNLYKFTSLETTFSVNSLAIDHDVSWIAGEERTACRGWTAIMRPRWQAGHSRKERPVSLSYRSR